ncbi:MAG: hypothetical protein A3K67_04565 [Euryarchaeota archaeon RBG_16_62_10]|nr:MAG: hypothetical protein A3K67_04565 [Euryarchaeota archaeon RBG_16_62_10]
MCAEVASVKPAKFLSPKTVALYGILTALTAAVTYVSYTPFSPTKGYFNLGDSIVFFTALTFGWRAGLVCGGIGSAAADILLGSGIFAPITLVAKGAEGCVAGWIAKKGANKLWAVVLAVGVGGSFMVVTYFLGEWLVLGMGLGKALAEVPINIGQLVLGGTIGATLSFYVRRSLGKQWWT